MRIGSHDTDQRVFIIAEIGNNHEGDFELAKEMVRAAAQAGADAVKFQTINPVELVSASQTARVAQLEKFRFSCDQFEQLAELTASCGALFMSTPFDLDAVRFLDELVPAFKVASGDNDFFPLLRAVAETGKPVVMSAGLMELTEVQRSRDYIRSVWQEKGISQDLAILHCVSCYPTPEEDANLRAIRALEGLNVVPGYSDHTLGIDAAVAAVAVGARIIEKHFTVDKNYSDFDDHQLSADPADLKEMVRRIREMETLLGNPGKGMSGCEKASKMSSRRSIVAKTDLPAGTLLKWENLSWVRPGGGVPPGRESDVLGKCLRQSVAKGEMILPDAFVEVE